MEEEDYRRQRHDTAKNSIAAGVVATVGLHAVLAVTLVFSGLKYIYPPPEEEGIEISFEEEAIPQTIAVSAGEAPRAPEANPDEDVRLAKAAESPYQGEKANEAEEAVNDEFGDVEMPDPRTEEQKKEIDQRALFPSADNKAAKDTLAAQTAARVSQALERGHSLGNTSTGDNEDEPNVQLKGRRQEGSLPKPEYEVQIDGKIVVQIWVDQNGNVTDAMAGVPGTTINDTKLWKAAEKAALGSKFNASSTAPIKQTGTITYFFKLK